VAAHLKGGIFPQRSQKLTRSRGFRWALKEQSISEQDRQPPAAGKETRGSRQDMTFPLPWETHNEDLIPWHNEKQALLHSGPPSGVRDRESDA
jgi:hypothetical protein